jgi:hypothetical protein
MFRRIMASLATAFVVVTGGVLGLQAPAWAVGVEMDGPSGTSGYYVVDYAQDAIVILVRSGYLPPGICATAYLDISRVAGVGQSGTHYDARAARTCKSNDSKTSSWQYEGGTYGIQIDGVNKAAVCYGANHSTGDCQNKVGLVATVNPVSTDANKCTRWWYETAGDLQLYYGAGAVNSCQS